MGYFVWLPFPTSITPCSKKLTVTFISSVLDIEVVAYRNPYQHFLPDVWVSIVAINPFHLISPVIGYWPNALVIADRAASIEG